MRVTKLLQLSLHSSILMQLFCFSYLQEFMHNLKIATLTWVTSVTIIDLDVWSISMSNRVTDQPYNYWLYHVSLPESHLSLLDPAHDEDTEEAGQQDPHGQGEDRHPRKLHGGQLVPQLCYKVSLKLLLWAHGCCGGGDGLPLGGCLLCGGGGCGSLGHSHFHIKDRFVLHSDKCAHFHCSGTWLWNIVVCYTRVVARHGRGGIPNVKNWLIFRKACLVFEVVTRAKFFPFYNFVFNRIPINFASKLDMSLWE